MKKVYLLDACALLSYFLQESGYEIVKSILKQAKSNEVIVYMNKVNVYEVYYKIKRTKDTQQAQEAYETTLDLPIKIINDISDDVMFEAGNMKSLYKMSLADSILLGQAIVLDATVITADHHEFDDIDKDKKISFNWIR